MKQEATEKTEDDFLLDLCFLRSLLFILYLSRGRHVGNGSISRGDSAFLQHALQSIECRKHFVPLLNDFHRRKRLGVTGAESSLTDVDAFVHDADPIRSGVFGLRGHRSVVAVVDRQDLLHRLVDGLKRRLAARFGLDGRTQCSGLNEEFSHSTVFQ